MICIILLVVILIWFQISPRDLTPNLNKLDVTNLRIEPFSDWKSSQLFFTVTNVYDSPITVIGSRLNGVNFHYIDFELPPGQTKDGNIILNGLNIQNSSSYDVKLTFTHEDGQYSSYSQTITHKKYSPGFIIMDANLTITDSNSVVYVVELQNTGNIPMVSAKILIDNYQVSLSLEKWLQPKDKITLDTSISLPFQKGTSWNIELEATYAEGSTFSATNIFTFQ